MKTVKKIIAFILNFLFYVLLIFMSFFCIVGRHLADWYKATFHTSFREVIYTFNLGIQGADISFMQEAVNECRSELAVFCVVTAVILIAAVLLMINRKKINGHKVSIAKALILVIAVIMCIPTYRYADDVLKVSEFLRFRFTNTKIYDEQYVSVNDVEVETADKRNVILIYLESLETTYASEELGGFQEENLIPGLTQLAQENVSFGDRDEGKLGGTHNPNGTTWTTGAILASESGVPFAFRIGKNQAGKEEAFAANLPTLGDFLRKEGYQEYFLCGSDSTFGGKKAFFEQHGDFDIYDYYNAIEDGYIAEDYKVWWGLEDHRLYEIARDKLTEAAKTSAKTGEPFNFTMLTVDTHHVGGYECEFCPDKYKSTTANVVACADNQICDFIDWCKDQDFYENTTIVIMGDHPRMDKKLVKGVDAFDREAYNCFINAVYDGEVEQKRLATTMDLFPTILSSMGYTIEGDRLGLGTNLFSDRPTLAEEMTYDKLNDEISRNSKYYLKNFS